MELMKIYLNCKSIKCILPRNYFELREMIMKSFRSECEHKMFFIYYIDEDRDLIFIENDYDYFNAMIYVKILLNDPQNEDSSIVKMLKIVVTFSKMHDNYFSFSNYSEKLRTVNEEEDFSFVSNESIDKKIKLLLNLRLKFAFKKWRLLKLCEVHMQSVGCTKCKRSFIESSLIKHFPFCSPKKRQPFNSQRQRIIDLEHFLFIRRYNVLRISHQLKNTCKVIFPRWYKDTNEKSKANWKQASLQLRYMAKVNRLLRNAS